VLVCAGLLANKIIMEIEVNEQNQTVLKKVYNSIILETAEGNQIAICMRDDTLEMMVVGFDDWHRADMETGKIESI